MKQLLISIWNGLWASHRTTKNTLKILPDTDGAGILHPLDAFQASYSRSQFTGLILGPVAFIFTIWLFSPEGLNFEARAVLAITLWVAIWWVTEAIPIPATALLPLVLMPITGALDSATVSSAYGDDIIFLFMGGFFIATAMEKWNLHKRIALAIIAFVGVGSKRILLGFMTATAFLSMWVSNTASVMMMVPMGLAIAAQVADASKGKAEAKDMPDFEKSLLFGIGYAGTIGGLGTLIGTPPNIILAAQANLLFGVDISFAGWMLVGVPVVILLMLIAWFYLSHVAFRISMREVPGGAALIRTERKALGAMSFEEKSVAVIFAFAAFMWISRQFIWANLVPEIRDGMIAIFCSILLFMIPTGQSGQRILGWEDSKNIPWGVLLLFGGGLAIAAGFQGSGLSVWMGSQLTVLEGLHMLIIISVAATMILFLTEITSNTATGTMILPVVAALALAINIHPFALMVPCAMAANCAFMLPVGTPPNAIIFATGKLRIAEMMRVGFMLNIIAAIIIVFTTYFSLPLMWGIDLNIVPASFLNP